MSGNPTWVIKGMNIMYDALKNKNCTVTYRYGSNAVAVHWGKTGGNIEIKVVDNVLRLSGKVSCEAVSVHKRRREVLHTPSTRQDIPYFYVDGSGEFSKDIHTETEMERALRELLELYWFHFQC
jgi:hypothetical protein